MGDLGAEGELLILKPARDFIKFGGPTPSAREIDTVCRDRHPQINAHLLRQWQLPSALEGPVQYHHGSTASTTHGRLSDLHSEFCVLNYRRSGSGTLDRMQLRSARLCLDCDEVHDAQQCPQCASETFAFITRWVPIPDRPDRPVKRSRAQEVASPDTLGAYQEMLQPQEQQGGKWRTVRRGAMGLALFGIAGWLWRHNSKPPGEDEAAGEETTNQKGT